jgi:lipopolysaccharide heptosyltransferase II
VERFVVVAPNWLGDAVMAQPAIADVRSARPGASLVVAARASVAPVFSLMREVDEVVVLPRRGPYPLGGSDVALLLPNSFHSALMIARAGVRERWGYRTDWRALLLTRAIGRPPALTHQIDSYQHLVRALGFSNGAAAPALDPKPACRAAGAEALTRAGWNGQTPLVAIAPGAAFGSAKRWPASAFAELADGLADDGVSVVLVGAEADRGSASDVMRCLRRRSPVLDLVGRTDIPTLAGAMLNCRALVGNDSGALHLAAALGVSVSAPFGPTDERTNAPRPRAASAEPRVPSREPRAAVFVHPVWCRPCWLRECPLDHMCMRGIAAADVLAATRRML